MLSSDPRTTAARHAHGSQRLSAALCCSRMAMLVLLSVRVQ